MASILKYLDRWERFDRTRVLRYSVVACVVLTILQAALLYIQLNIHFERDLAVEVTVGGDGLYRTIVPIGAKLECYSDAGSEDIQIRSRSEERGGETVIFSPLRPFSNIVQCKAIYRTTIASYIVHKLLRGRSDKW